MLTKNLQRAPTPRSTLKPLLGFFFGVQNVAHGFIFHIQIDKRLKIIMLL